MASRYEQLNYLQDYDLNLKEKLGQHLLVDTELLQKIGKMVSPGATVIEIGAGPGNLTEQIAQHANEVHAIEIDSQYTEILSDLANLSKNIHVIIGDALRINMMSLVDKHSERPTQIIANIPYHISEPLLKKLTQLPIEEALLMVGDNLGTTLQITNPQDDRFTRSSLIAQTYFEVEQIAKLSKDAFFPPPRTESIMIRLTPKQKFEMSYPSTRIFRQLIEEGSETSVEKILKSALITGTKTANLPKKDSNRKERRDLHRELRDLRDSYRAGIFDEEQERYITPPLERISLSEQILRSRFTALGNDDLRQLVTAVKNLYPDL